MLKLTNSAAWTYETCPKRYEFRYLRRLASHLSAPALSFGSLFHALQEAYWRAIQARQKTGAQLVPLVEVMPLVLADAGRKWAEERRAEFRAHIEAHGVDEAAEQALGDGPGSVQGMLTLAMGMMQRHAEKYAAADEARWQVLGVELHLAAPLTSSAVQVTTMYEGKIDLILRDKSTGAVYIVDHKTTAETRPDRYNATLDLSPQMMGYAWLVGRCVPELPAAPSGAIFNVARKKLPAEPKPLAKRTKGRGLSIASTDTTAEMFRAAVAEHDPGNEAAYEEILRKLDARGDTFLWRHEYVFPDGALEHWHEGRKALARQMKACARKGAEFPRSMSACTPFVGAPCPYRHLCLVPGAEHDPWALAAFRVDAGTQPVELPQDTEEPMPF